MSEPSTLHDIKNDLLTRIENIRKERDELRNLKDEFEIQISNMNQAREDLIEAFLLIDNAIDELSKDA
jgi:hypothetical protein